ncbi:MAG TPA: glycosyltransferase family 9 protein [Acidimicrobiia bacterium]|nr:glycosyltransferase family 9 protein [Acidimicrobiia bacterium]
MNRVLVVRLDNAGDVILAGPAVRAVAADDEVTVLCGPAGEAAARLLPGVTDLIVWEAPWVGFAPPRADLAAISGLMETLDGRGFSAAAVLTSFHQSPLPMALLLRLAGIERIAAVSVDYPGSLLDHRLPYVDDLHEVEQALTVTAALGYAPPEDDRLSLLVPAAAPESPLPGYVVVHPGASVPARALPQSLANETIDRLVDEGRRVVVTGTEVERQMSAISVASPQVEDLRGLTSFEHLVAIIAAADAIVVGNTGPAHIAAATGTPVVSIFAPVVPAHRWQPWKVPLALLGDQRIECAGCRARTCPLSDQTCVAEITATQVVKAVDHLAPVTHPARRPA